MTTFHSSGFRRLRLLVAVAGVALALVSCITLALNSQDVRTIYLRPGNDLKGIIEASGEGTVFRFSPGTYYIQGLKPKDRQQFIGQSGVVLSGAAVLKDWRREGGLWMTKAGAKRLAPHGECERKQALCMFREDLFVAGVLYAPVASQEQLAPGKWYRDDEIIVLSEDPVGKLIEMSSASWAIAGSAKGVVLEKLVVEKFASSAQYGAIDGRDGENWNLVDVVARWNHGVGLYVGKGMRVVGGTFSHNGQLGIGGEGDDAIIDRVEIASNNYAGFSADWEAGGTKFVRSERLIVRNSCIHHNDGPGLWTDIDNVDVSYINNRVFLNTGDGIKHEISYRAWVLGNTVAWNGKAKDAWLWGSQILIQNSSNVVVRNNTVEVARDFGNGISIISQDRGTGSLGRYVALGNKVTGNTIVHLGQAGHSGIVVDADIDAFWKSNDNTFDKNAYILAVPKAAIFGVNNQFGSWREARLRGYEAHGTLKTEKPAPIALHCGK